MYDMSSRKSDPIKVLKDTFTEIEEETKEKMGDDAFHWMNHYGTWIDVITSVTNSMPNEESGNSMLVLRLLELQKILSWIQLSALYGAYRPLIRELRFTLESFLQAYYLETKYPSHTIESKHEILFADEKKLYGGRLIDKINIGSKEEIRTLYQYLSKYQHGSYNELKTTVLDGNVAERVIGDFDKELFDECMSLTNRVMDIVFYLILYKYPEAISKFKNDMTIYWLKELDSPITLKLLFGNL